jgi:hypothetical protein
MHRRWRCIEVGPVRHFIEQVEHDYWGWGPVPGARAATSAIREMPMHRAGGCAATHE